MRTPPKATESANDELLRRFGTGATIITGEADDSEQPTIKSDAEMNRWFQEQHLSILRAMTPQFPARFWMIYVAACLGCILFIAWTMMQ